MSLNHTLKFIPAAALLLVTAWAGAATQTFGPTLFDNGGLNYAAGAGGVFSFPQFNPALGTLTQVDLTVSGNSFGGSNNADSESDNAGTIQLKIGSNVTVTGPSALVVLTQPNQDTGVVAVTADSDASADYVGGDSLVINGTNSTDTQSNTLLSGFAPYTGVSTVNFNFTSAVNTFVNASVAPVFTFTSAPTFNFTPTVVYTYDPVPEPASMSLLGLCGLPLLRRRRI